MLLKTTASRIAAALAVALVAIVLVVSGSATRASDQRIGATVDDTASSAASHRQTFEESPLRHQHPPQHHEPASTPPPPHDDRLSPVTTRVHRAEEAPVHIVDVAPTGRAPPGA